MGSKREAFIAGHIPKNKPMLTEARKPTTTDQSGTAEYQPSDRIRKVRDRPARIPSTPPVPVRVIASNRNCQVMSLRRAPMALRTPISRVRSVTETSMMFITPMPPTMSPMDEITMVTITTVAMISRKLAYERLRRGDAKTVRRRGFITTQPAQHGSGFILRLGQPAGKRHGGHKELLGIWIKRLESEIGYVHDFIVAIITQERFAFRQRSNHDKGMPVHLDFLANRILSGKESFHHIGPDDGHVRPMQVVEARVKAGHRKYPH